MNSQIGLKVFILASFLSASVSVGAVVTWTGLGDGVSWADGDNWDSTLTPTVADDLVFTNLVDPGGLIGFSGSDNFSKSLTFNAGFAANTLTVDTGSPNLQLNGNLSNNSVNAVAFEITVSSWTAGQTWSGNLNFKSAVNLFRSDTLAGRSVTLDTGTINFSGTANVNFSVTGAAAYSSLAVTGNGTVNYSGATLNFNSGSYTAMAGNVFDFTTGSFTGASIGSLPSIDSGATWDSSQLLSNGILTAVAVPEPTTWVLMGLSLPVLVVVRRRVCKG